MGYDMNNANNTDALKGLIRTIPDFPEPGILFRDITTVLKDAGGLRLAVDAVADSLRGVDFDVIVGPESRGFIFGVPVAYLLGKGFVPVRKAGKLPAETFRKGYALEYGTAELEVHKDALKEGQRVVIVDDLLATGGTSRAIADLAAEIGAEVAAMSFFIELEGLRGRDALKGFDIRSIVRY